ncbi:MAG: M23 family metallopeptidase [Anaerolineae bacterium]
MRRLILFAGLLLAACVPAPQPNIEALPTVDLTDEPEPSTTPAAVALPEQGAVPTATDIPATPTIPPTLPPLLTLPDAEGVSLVCESNALRVTLASDSAPVSRIEASEDRLYLLIEGGVYTLPVAEAAEGMPDPLLVPGDPVGSRAVQELQDLALDSERDRLYALDKSGSIYRLPLEGGPAELVYDSRDIGLVVGPQLLAIDVDEAGRSAALDSANGYIWVPRDPRDLRGIATSTGLTSGIDVAHLDGRFYVMRQDAAILEVDGEEGADAWQDATGRRLALSLKVSRHLGPPLFLTVDGVKREVVGIQPEGAVPVTRHVFAFPQMGLLRDAAFAGGRLYAVADSDLYIYPRTSEVGETEAAGCPYPETFADPTLYGIDVVRRTSGFTFPIEDGTLPVWPRIYPGAARLYRVGVHRGLDIYQWNAPQGFRAGWPIVAIEGGRVSTATVPYDDLTSVEFYEMLDAAREIGTTPEDTLDRLYGKQVIIEHTGGFWTRYAHMSDIDEAIDLNGPVSRGQAIGTVGVTGSEGEVRPGSVAAHLHFEIWFEDRYLGQGITLRETMWWFEQIFGE